MNIQEILVTVRCSSYNSALSESLRIGKYTRNFYSQTDSIICMEEFFYYFPLMFKCGNKVLRRIFVAGTGVG
jgi:hypothetical protein